MTEYIIGKAKVRIHGSPNSDNIKEATLKFLKKAEAQRKKVQREAREKTHSPAKKANAAMET